MLAMSLLGKTALCLCLLFAIVYADEGCDKSKCPGPVKFLEELNCKPVYAKPDDCCPVRYDCSHLEGRKADKCYAKGHEYAIGDPLKEEDAKPCDIGCRCVEGYNNVATFTCAVVDCFHPPPKPGCYLKREVNSCCPSGEVCPKEGEERATCQVDGKTYHESEAFYPEGKPNLSCICQEGFKGEFVEPFCKAIDSSCSTEMRQSAEIKNKCVPVYYSNQSPTTSCSVFFRCQNDKDKVINTGAAKSSEDTSAEDKSDKSDSKEENSDMKCKFGNLLMNVGDELEQATDYSSVCVKCVCEVPPVPTCQRLSDSECDVTKHPEFN